MIHAAHSAFANQGGDLIGAEATAGADGHVRQILHGFRRRDSVRWRAPPNLKANRAQRT